RRRVVRLLDAVTPGERAADRRLLVVVVPPGEDEVIVGDRRLAREDRLTARDLIERVDGKRRRAVGGGQEICVDAERGARRECGVLVAAVGPDDLLGRRQAAGGVRIGPLDRRRGLRRGGELTASGGEDAAGPSNLVFLRRQRNRLVSFSLGLVGEPAG